jgi:hypothetical protein
MEESPDITPISGDDTTGTAPLHVIAGGAETEDDAVRAAWAKIAAATEEALIEMGPHHPRRADFLELRADFLRAAQRPLAPSLKLTA